MMRKVLALGALCAAALTANAQIVTNLEQGGKIFWKFNGGQFSIQGALTDSGSISASDAIEFPLQDLNGDGRKLDIRLCIQELFDDLGIEYCLDLIGTVISESSNEAIIRWAAQANPNQCVNVSVSGAQAQVLITLLAGSLQARVTPIQCQNNPYNSNWQKVTLRLEDNGGDTHNFLRVEGYLLCFQIPQTFAEARIFNMDWEAYAGGFTGVFGNVNGDSIVDDADLLEVLFNFGSAGGSADANGDGVVDDADLLIVLFNFGASCGG